MRYSLNSICLLILLIIVVSCKKGDSNTNTDCSANAATIRQITNRQAVVKVTATIIDVYLVEQGSIDTKLIPCNLPMEFYQNNLQVIISGDVKLTPQTGIMPCCAENFVISKITR